MSFPKFEIGNLKTMVAATTFAFFSLGTAGYAHSPEEEQACTPDAFRLCTAEIPDEARITACMERQKALLSPACRVFFKTPGPTADRSKPAKPMSLTPAKPKKASG